MIDTLNSLAKLFTGTACKYLSAVDADASVSNQHEIGSNKFAEFLGVPGTQKLSFPATFVLFDTDAQEPEICHDEVTWYDTRIKQPQRSPEYRLYYRTNIVTEHLQEGQFCLIGRMSSGKILIAVARRDSSDEYRLRHLFGLTQDQGDVNKRWAVSASVRNHQIDLASAQILDALGIDLPADETVDVEKLIHQFSGRFPPTKLFSEVARKALGNQVSAIEAPDEALERWMQCEESMFRALEKVIVQETLNSQFSDVETFIAFSLSVQNRRKSRAGHALENHLSAIFDANQIRYVSGAFTENRAKPDFLFPGIVEYRDASVSSPPLRMLAAKTTCKDRWRQILSEAARIPEKHLFTLETAISANQLSEMLAQNVVLVTVPSISATYQGINKHSVRSLSDFIGLVR